LLTGCPPEKNDNSDNFDNDITFDEITFMSKWNTWNNNNIKNYSFTLEESFYSISRGLPDPYSYEFKILVKNGVMDSFEYFVYYDGKPFEVNENSLPPFTSISDMYQKIYDDVQNTKKFLKDSIYSYEYKLEYDSELYFITYYTVISYNPNMSAWPKSPFRVLDFKILE
jgi:hypothetical protein